MKKLIVIVVSLLCCCQSLASANIKQTELQDQINKYVAKAERYNPHTAVAGIIVKSLKTNKVLYQQNSDRLFTPASIQKLITASAALIYLKPTFRFQTTVLKKGNIEKGTLHGDLTIKFGGDPELTTDELRLMIQQLGKLGIDKIDGHVYIDNSAYDNVPYAPGWIWDDLSYSYGAPVNAIIIDHNKFGLHFIPGRIGHHPKLVVDLPVKDVIQFTNNIRTVQRLPGNCPITIYSDMHNHYTVGGCLLKRSGEQRRSLAIRDMPHFARALIAKILTENNISYIKPVTMHRAPSGSTQIAIYYSPPLSAVVKEMLKESDNLTTNSVFKKIGQMYYRRQASWQTSLKAIKAILSKTAGLQFKQNLLAGGAGMSRYNLIKPILLLQLLTYDYHDRAVRRVLMRALPIAGVDGTLQYRMHAAAKGHRIAAKTGTMTGISGLAGYIRSQHNGELAFVMIFNNFVGSVRRYTHYQDKICLYLMQAPKVSHG